MSHCIYVTNERKMDELSVYIHWRNYIAIVFLQLSRNEFSIKMKYIKIKDRIIFSSSTTLEELQADFYDGDKHDIGLTTLRNLEGSWKCYIMVGDKNFAGIYIYSTVSSLYPLCCL